MSVAKISCAKVLELLHERKALPVFPGIIRRLDEAIADPHMTIDSVVRLLSADIAIASRILKASKSARYGLSVPNSLQEAVARLGMAEVRAIAFSVSFRAGFIAPPHLDLKLFWRHAFAAAVAGRVLSHWFMHHQQQPICDESTAFLLGLSHDMGVLLLDLLNPTAYEQVIAAVASGDDLLLSEQRFLGTTHALMGAALMHYWRFSEPMSMAVAGHHYPTRLQPAMQPWADLVLLSEVIAVRLGYPNGVYHRPSATMQGVIEQRCALLGITETDLIDIGQLVDVQLTQEGWLAFADEIG